MGSPYLLIIKNMFEERLLNVNEVSHRLGICKTTCRRWADSGKLKTRIISDRGDRRYYLSSVLKVMGLTGSKHKDENKVEIRTIDDAVRYTIGKYIFKDSPQGLANVASTIEEEYGFDRKEILSKVHEMLGEGIIQGKKGKNAGLIIAEEVKKTKR